MKAANTKLVSLLTPSQLKEELKCVELNYAMTAGDFSALNSEKDVYRQKRILSGKTTKDMSKILGVSTATYVKWENSPNMKGVGCWRDACAEIELAWHDLNLRKKAADKLTKKEYDYYENRLISLKFDFDEKAKWLENHLKETGKLNKKLSITDDELLLLNAIKLGGESLADYLVGDKLKDVLDDVELETEEDLFDTLCSLHREYLSDRISDINKRIVRIVNLTGEKASEVCRKFWVSDKHIRTDLNSKQLERLISFKEICNLS